MTLDSPQIHTPRQNFPQMRSRLLRAPEVAELLAISVRGVWRLRRAGRLPCVRVGGAVRFRLADVQALQREGTA